jgi:hypothetical protein
MREDERERHLNLLRRARSGKLGREIAESRRVERRLAFARLVARYSTTRTAPGVR